MRICENGAYRDMTVEEIAAMQSEQERMVEETASQPPTPEERLAAMEAAMIALMEVV